MAILINKSKRPVLLIGAGIIESKAEDLLLQWSGGVQEANNPEADKKAKAVAVATCLCQPTGTKPNKEAKNAYSFHSLTLN